MTTSPRPGTRATVGQPNIGGTVFYLAGSGSANVTSNSGATSSGNPCSTAANFAPTSGGATGFGVKCTSGSVIPGNLPTFTGNVLLAPCTGTYGDQTLATTGNVDPTLGQQRGILFFQSRAAQNANASVNGGGTYITAGTLYFHACNASGTGLGCTYYSDSLTLGGNGGGSTYTFGDIVTDSLSLGGASSVTMDLNPGVTFGILKATLIR